MPGRLRAGRRQSFSGAADVGVVRGNSGTLPTPVPPTCRQPGSAVELADWALARVRPDPAQPDVSDGALEVDADGLAFGRSAGWWRSRWRRLGERSPPLRSSGRPGEGAVRRCSLDRPGAGRCSSAAGRRSARKRVIVAVAGRGARSAGRPGPCSSIMQGLSSAVPPAERDQIPLSAGTADVGPDRDLGRSHRRRGQGREERCDCQERSPHRGPDHDARRRARRG